MKIKLLITAVLMSFVAFGYETWTDPNTGITWTYTVSKGKVRLGSGDCSAISISTAGAITIPSTINDYSVTSIMSSAFLGCSGLTNVTIPSSVTSIGSYAFYGCSGLTSVTIPSSVTSIGNDAFKGCSKLTSVTIPSSVKGVSEWAFYGCTGLTSVTISEGVMSIDAGAFKGCSKLTSVTIPSSVTSIGERVFSGCRGLTSVIIPSSVTSIGYEVFCDCSGLTNVTIPPSVTSIGDRAFSGCSGLTSVIIPSSVTSIGCEVFSDCSGLTSVTIPEGVTSIGTCAFYGCSKLTSVTIPSSVTSIIEYPFCYCDNLAVVDFEGTPPEGLVDAGFEQDIVIHYNVAYEDAWLPVIAECGWTNASSYAPYTPKSDGVVSFVVPNGVSSTTSYVYTNATYGLLPEAKRDGFTFAGWYTSPNGTNRVSAFSTVDTNVKTLYARWVEDDTSLYAQWKANAYSVSFNANGGEGEMASQPFFYDQTQALSGNTFTKLGYTFKGWSAEPDGEVVFSDMDSVSNLTAEAEFAVALFAKWEKVIEIETEVIEDWVAYDLAPTFKKQDETKSQYRKRFETKFGDDYATAFFAETGKVGMDGTRLCVWHDYVAGTDPLDETSQFKATVTMEDGVPIVRWTPALNGEGIKDGIRHYKVLGAKEVGGEWLEVNGDESDYRFFKVMVEMP